MMRRLAILAAVLLTLLPLGSSAAERTGPAAATVPGGTPVPAPGAPPSVSIPGLDRLIHDRLGQSDLRGTRISVLIETFDGRVLYEMEPDLPLVPASNMKIVTAACALSTLGPDYQFVTDVGAKAELIDGSLKGDLYVRGSGDPSLVSEELWKICDEVRARGISRIEGDIVLDATRFDALPTATPDADDGDRAYDARTGALSLNFNTVRVHVYPGRKSGADAIVSLSPDAGFVELRNSADTGSSRRGSTLEVRRDYEGGRNVVKVSGRIPEGAPGQTLYRNLDDPLGCFGSAMRDFLARAGVEVTGTQRAGSYPDGAWVVHSHRSKPLSLIVRDLGKFSNNFAAEQLLKAMSAERNGSPGTTAGGAAILSAYLESVGAEGGEFHIVDGSGLSRENRLTTRAVIRVLRTCLNEFELSYEFAASLSVSGTDGTLSDRMGFPGLRGSVRAKTGLLDGVTAISGILRTVAGDTVLFSIITNGYTCEAWQLHDVEHEILAHAARSLPRLGGGGVTGE